MKLILLDSNHIALSIHFAHQYSALVSGVYRPKSLQEQPFEQAQLVAFLPKTSSIIETLDGMEKVICKAEPGRVLEHQYLISSKRLLKKPYYWQQLEEQLCWKRGRYINELIMAASFVLGGKSKYHLKTGARLKFWDAKHALALAQFARKNSKNMLSILHYKQVGQSVNQN